MAKTLTFSLSPDQFSICKTELTGQGVAVTGNAGTIDYKGVEVQYSYNGTDTLTVIVEHKPFLVPESVLEEKLAKWFQNPDLPQGA
jgi:hypothetical protein